MDSNVKSSARKYDAEDRLVYVGGKQVKLDQHQKTFTDFGIPEPKPKERKKPQPKKPTIRKAKSPTVEVRERNTQPIDPPNPIPDKMEYRKLRNSRFPYLCAECGQRFPAGSSVFRRSKLVIVQGEQALQTTTYCPTCWRWRNTGRR